VDLTDDEPSDRLSKMMKSVKAGGYGVTIVEPPKETIEDVVAHVPDPAKLHQVRKAAARRSRKTLP
jgi:hypothetical protein